jgi:3-oxoacyl-[acyl-carrier protein] reductase
MKEMLKRICNRFIKNVVQPVYIPTIQGDLLKGKTALVTGGTSGIGYAAARAFARCGCKCVIITGRTQARCDVAAAQLIQETGCSHIIGIELDLNSPGTIESTYQRILEEVGSGIEILLNNAGVYDGTTFADVSLDVYDKVMSSNLRGPFILTQIVSSDMIKRGINGNICNLCSSSSYRPAIDPYMLSKWGMRGFTLGLAKKLIKHGIVVNGIAPGPTATPMLMDSEAMDLKHNSTPSGRYATAEEIANFIVIMVSGMGRMIVGDVVCMSGGAGIITYDDVNNY